MNFKIIICLVFMYAAFTVACSDSTKPAEETAVINTDTITTKDFSNVVFATKKDTSCGMPLTAGIEDTLHFDGKIYGFCSKECKDAFVTHLKSEKKL